MKSDFKQQVLNAKNESEATIEDSNQIRLISSKYKQLKQDFVENDKNHQEEISKLEKQIKTLQTKRGKRHG